MVKYSQCSYNIKYLIHASTWYDVGDYVGLYIATTTILGCPWRLVGFLNYSYVSLQSYIVIFRIMYTRPVGGTISTVICLVLSSYHFPCAFT